MTNDTPRRAVLAAVLAAGTGGLTLSSASDLLDSFAPQSGNAWDAADRPRPETVESPHGDASVHVDDDGVPHVAADGEQAAYFAVGYLQAFDRLFSMDLQRRAMRGRLSAVVGEATVESDEFHIAMGFAEAAETTWDLVSDTATGPLVAAYADGVNAAIDAEPLSIEFELLGYEPRPWSPADSMLMEKQISWTLTGEFGELRRALLVDRLGEDRADDLFPRRLDHDVPILDGDETRLTETESDEARFGDTAGADARLAESDDIRADDAEPRSRHDPIDADLTEWLSRFESPTGVGSNSWVVSGDHTASGTPIVAYDPHLSLIAPPLWYEQHVETSERSVRGATFPGVPFVIAGANDGGTWSFTNLGADVLDCYRYEIDDEGERYRYDGEWREFEVEARAIPVSGGEDRTLAVKRTVHGPLIEREGRRVGVAWTGHTATRTTVAVDELGRSDGRASQLVPDLVAAVDGRGPNAEADRDRLDEAADTLDAWDYRMTGGSRGALLFARRMDRFRRAVMEPTFAAADLDETYYPNDWVVATLSPDDPLFADRSRAETMVAALRGTLDEVDEEGWETYGDWNSTRAVSHPLGGEAPFLNYETLSADGSPVTVRNYRVESGVGSSWRMVVRPGTDATAVLPGGNSGDYFSEHYADQLRRWLRNDQKSMSLDIDGDETIGFRGDSS